MRTARLALLIVVNATVACAGTDALDEYIAVFGGGDNSRVAYIQSRFEGDSDCLGVCVSLTRRDLQYQRLFLSEFTNGRVDVGQELVDLPHDFTASLYYVASQGYLLRGLTRIDLDGAMTPIGVEGDRVARSALPSRRGDVIAVATSSTVEADGIEFIFVDAQSLEVKQISTRTIFGVRDLLWTDDDRLLMKARESGEADAPLRVFEIDPFTGEVRAGNIDRCYTRRTDSSFKLPDGRELPVPAYELPLVVSDAVPDDCLIVDDE